MNSHVSIKTLFSLFLLLAALPASVAMELHSVQFPERRTVDVFLEPLEGAPRARIDTKVTYRDGQARIELGFESMKPAILFAGDVTCYVVWAVTRSGETENLGELIVDEPKGQLVFATGKKDFALIVTAEPYYLVKRPSELVVFYNFPSRDKRAPSTPFEFTRFDPAPNHAMKSITAIAWDSKTPLPLLQARKAYELAGRYDAERHAGEIYREAGDALVAANELERKSPSSRKLLDNARRAVALANEAINISLRRIEGIELEKQIAARRAEMQGLENRVADAEADIQRVREEKQRMADETMALRQEKAGLEAGMADLRRERNQLEQATERLQREKSDLGVRLQDALSHVAETRSSARGYVVNLPDILFDVNQATLKVEARTVLAKLAGILLVIPDLTVVVEGHTDSTGSEEYNLRLSRMRAESVLEFLTGEGVARTRLEAMGYGLTRPVADNATAEGRQKNRRVEIVITEG